MRNYSNYAGMGGWMLIAASLAGCSMETASEPGADPTSKAASALVETQAETPESSADSSSAADSEPMGTPIPFDTVPTIARPINLHRTADSQECAAHFPAGLFWGLGCAASIANGDVMLVWDWVPQTCSKSPCLTAIDGYHIWRADGTKPTKLIDTQNGADLTARGTAKPADGKVCYTVTAFSGTHDSPPSDAFCFTQGKPTTKNVTLNPSDLATLIRGDKDNKDTFSGVILPGLNLTAVGFTGDSSDGFFGLFSYWWWSASASAARFELGSISFKEIASATLHVKTIQADGACNTDGLGSAEDFAFNVSKAEESWSSGVTFIGTQPFPPSSDARTFTLREFHANQNSVNLDVTSMVRDWAASPGHNHGVLVKGPHEGNTEKDARCAMQLNGFTLDVEFDDPTGGTGSGGSGTPFTGGGGGGIGNGGGQRRVPLLQ